MRSKGKIFGLLCCGVLPYAVNGFYNALIASRPPIFWAVDLTSWVLAPTAILCLGLRNRLFTMSNVGLSRNVFGRQNEGVLAAVAVAAIPFLIWADSAFHTLGVTMFPESPAKVPFNYQQMIPPPGPTTGLYRLVVLAYFAASAGFVEELYYRGLMRLFFGEGLVQSILYVAISTLVFSGVHWKFGAHTMIEAFGYGLAAAGIFACIRNLWPLIIAHALIDLRYFL